VEEGQGHNISHSNVYLCISIYDHIFKNFLMIVQILLFECTQILTVNYFGLRIQKTFDPKKNELEYKQKQTDMSL
jgi:hypothetical protein